ncbi:MAG: UrcA family protein [Hyphomonadaceae bacterium]
MDTTNASPKTSSIISGILSAALALGAAAWTISAGVGIASAQTPEAVAAKVSHADLNLRSEDGARAYLKRVNVTAKEMCGNEPVHSPLFPRAPARFNRCVQIGVETGVYNSGEPLVIQLHAGSPLSGSMTLASR